MFKMRLKRTIRALALRMSMSNFLPNNVFLGANTIITKSVTIGDNVIVGAGSIVTKDIPSNEIWAGVPARFIKKYN